MTDTGPQPERHDEPGGHDEPEGHDQPGGDDQSKGIEDEANRKFREALERKRDREAATAGGLGGKDAGKVQGAHGPARSRRSFRRRGGG
jgi:hypothetical protein